MFFNGFSLKLANPYSEPTGQTSILFTICRLHFRFLKWYLGGVAPCPSGAGASARLTTNNSFWRNSSGERRLDEGHHGIAFRRAFGWRRSGGEFNLAAQNAPEGQRGRILAVLEAGWARCSSAPGFHFLARL